MLERCVDVVDAAHQPILAQRTDLKSMARPVRRDQQLIWQINCYFSAGILTQLLLEAANDVFGKGGDENAILNAIDLKYLAKARTCALSRRSTRKGLDARSGCA